MTFDMERVLESKRQYRKMLAALPIEEKLRMLDALRDRQILIREAGKAHVEAQREAKRETEGIE